MTYITTLLVQSNFFLCILFITTISYIQIQPFHTFKCLLSSSDRNISKLDRENLLELTVEYSHAFVYFLSRIRNLQAHSLTKPRSIWFWINERMQDEMFCFFINQFSTPSYSIGWTTTRSETPIVTTKLHQTSNSIDKTFIQVFTYKLFRIRHENRIPVFVKASTPLILDFPPVIPTNLSYTRIHVSVCKHHPSKRSPRSSKICI